MKKNIFLYLSLFLVIELQIMYPVSVLADTATQVNSSDKEQTSERSKEVMETSTTSDNSNVSYETLESGDSSTSKTVNNSTENEKKESITEQTETTAESTNSRSRAKVALATTAEGSWGKVTWIFDSSSGALTITGTGALGDSKTSPWNRTDDLKINAADVKKIVFTKAVTAPSDSSFLFSSLSPRSNRLRSLISIEGIENLDTSQVINMSNMFYDMTSIISLDLSTLNTNKSTNFYSMFEGASSLKELNITNFNTQNGSTKNMFFGDNNLSKITLGSNFKGQATGLPAISHSNGYSGNWMNQTTNVSVGTSDAFITNYDGLAPGTFVWQKQLWNDVSWDFSNGVLTFLDTGSFNESKNSPWNRTDDLKINAEDVKKIVFTKAVTAPSDSSFLFSSLSPRSNRLRSLISIEGIENLDTSQVTNMSNMFYEMSSIASLDLSAFNTNKSTNFYSMFEGVSSLKELNITNFNTQNGSTKNMFFGDNNLSKITLGSNFKGQATGLPAISHSNGYSGNWMNQTTNVSVGTSDAFITNYDGSAPGTFVWQKQLWNDVSWDFSNGVLTFLDTGSFNESKNSPWNRTDDLKINAEDVKKIVFTKAVTAPSDSSYLFSSISSTSNRLKTLTSIEGIKNLDTSQVTNMSNMFYEMSSITSLDLSAFNTNKSTNFYSMFEGASSLKELNITNFNTQNGSTRNMFYRDNNLSKITLGSSFRGQATGLPNVPKDDLYSGTWVYQTNNQTVGTSQEFLANYDGQNPGTYVWGSAEDPLNPTDPNQANLVLKSVPTAYTFKSKLFYSSYKVDGTVSTDNQVVVYNNRMERNWSVKASIVGDELTLKNGTSIIPVNSFTINSSNILDPQTKGIVAESPTDKTISNNVGDVQTDVSNVSIGFTDTDNQLKVGSELQGTIRYQLYNTASAE
ncbi:BspA family leucine-rich repeat surface protein [Enterococcus plantarum]|uniref:BspA family leucine-rich repeat surface protein n=1 Tax=Enterococcus plantarum TaxID=1077675 RepID=UPI001A8D370B|nr:BspA family leucine-rich repeat surface protein [Enterococcus plantarum]MBO0467259.1 BspA family leucine-rich repeat surface protein [Enterococcus plantarum]